MWAARVGHLDVVRLLIDHGADTSYSRELHGNVLHVAAFHGTTAVGSYLLSRGVDIESRGPGAIRPRFMWQRVS